LVGTMLFLAFVGGGLLIARYWLPRVRPLTRWYLGASIGLMLWLWLPVLWAYAIAFTVTAHILAILTLALLVMLAYLTRDRRSRVRFSAEDRRMLRAVLVVTIPLAVLAAWLEYTHSIRPTSDGYHVGQSTYGDLSLHLAVTTSIVGASFPLHNSLMIGATMAYPYLADSFAASFLLLGSSLSASMAITGLILCLYVFFGYSLLCSQLCRSRGAMWLAVCLLFFNGGLGFFYTLGGTVQNGVTTTFWDNLRNVMTGFYQTPTNQPDPNNLRWVNIVCDMLVPQRGILGGWTMLLAVLNLVLPPLVRKRRPDTRAMVLAGLLAGGMPLLHTHSFLALALGSLGFCIYATATAPKGQRMDAFKPFLIYGAIAATLAQSQLVSFTFVQATASDHFLRFQFNWCNNRGGNGLVDLYFWFYIKNIGLPYLLILLALLARRNGDLRGEAERAAALTDGLYVVETEAGAAALASPSALIAPQPEPEPEIEPEPLPEPEPEPEPTPPESDETEDDSLAARAYVVLKDMPAYGQSRMPVSEPVTRAAAVDLPYLRPLPPEKLRAAAYSPDDNDRVGVMRAVTGDAPPDVSHRPLLEELFHATYRRHDPDAHTRHRDFTDGMPETCFADEPPARDWVRQNRLLALGAFLILLVAEFFLFQPNEYDNNKLIYVWFLLCLPMAANYALDLYARLKTLPGRRTLAALTLTVFFLSAGFTVAREVVSDYAAYSPADIAVADFVKANTPEHSVFVTGNQHLNPVASLAGRSIVCGSDLYLYYHGFNTTPRKLAVQAFYEDPQNHLDLLWRYQVQYIYLSPSEWNLYNVRGDELRALFSPVYESADGSYLILSVPPAYRAVPKGQLADVQAQGPAPTATPDPALNPASGG